MQSYRLRVFVFAVSAIVTPAATLTGPVYPPPAGVTFNSYGTIAASGPDGRTSAYGNLSPEQYEELYWGVQNVPNVRHSTQAPTGYMTFSGFDAQGSAIYSSTANWTFSTYQTTYSYATRLRLQILPYAQADGTFIASGLPMTNMTAAGITPPPNAQPNYPVLDVLAVAPGGFRTQYIFEANSGGNWLPVVNFYDLHPMSIPNQSVLTSLSASFWYAEVPEPATAALAAVGILVIAVRRRFH